MARSISPASRTARGSRVVSGTNRKLTSGALASKCRIKGGMSTAAVASAMASTKFCFDVTGSK